MTEADGETSTSSVPQILIDQLEQSEDDKRPIVIMMCGISGAGKTTLSTLLTTQLPQLNFQHLSIDRIIHATHGMYSIDYPAELYAQYQTEAESVFNSSTIRLLQQTPPANIILDRSFYARKDRDQYRKIVQDNGGRPVLVYFDVQRDVLWRRIEQRKASIGGRSADAAFEMTEEVLDRYLQGFEVPSGEGEIVVRVV